LASNSDSKETEEVESSPPAQRTDKVVLRRRIGTRLSEERSERSDTRQSWREIAMVEIGEGGEETGVR